MNYHHQSSFMNILNFAMLIIAAPPPLGEKVHHVSFTSELDMTPSSSHIESLNSNIATNTTSIITSPEITDISIIAKTPVKTKLSFHNTIETAPESSIYETIIQETILATETYLDPNSAYAPISTPNDYLTYTMSDGPSYQSGDQSPDQSKSYDIETEILTILPVYSQSTSQEDERATFTLEVPQQYGEPATSTESDSTTTSSYSSSPSYTASSSSISVALPFGGIAPGGWNATSTFEVTNTLPRSSPSASASTYPTSMADSDGLINSLPTSSNATSYNYYHSSSSQPSRISVHSSFLPSTGFQTFFSTITDSIVPFPSPSPSSTGTGIILGYPYSNISSTLPPTGFSNSISSSIIPSQLSSSAYASSYILGSIYTTPPIPLPTESSPLSQCDETDSFVLRFDDIPPLAIGYQPYDSVQPMPLFNPYHHFDFSDGFTVVPPPTDPYIPSSKPLLLEYIPPLNSDEKNNDTTYKDLSQQTYASIGNSDHGLTGCFNFIALGASFGCDSTGPDCDFSFSGFRYNKNSRLASEVANQRQSIRSCPSLKECTLTSISFASSFENLDFLRINLTVAGEPKIWWMDDLSLAWSNKTCAACQCRLRTHIY
ncbi:hypothetical protein GcC1_066001 [Golovinomyces cichoracearum]|uniref:DUF7371 domain-containing protein n=1 Tax=Golovinomyces cichoracearum TaxID=62708 RepID=A0A420IRI9_9PEZI|nr:hypothetical protein GcC1_066001 [Golovinomyces cichoracearum]